MSKKMTMEEFAKYANNTVSAVADANGISNENMKKLVKAVDVEENRGVLDIKGYSSASSYLKKSENERKNLVFEFSSILGECPRDSRRSKRRLEGGWLDSSACQISGSEI